jgi:hypothetical protein
LAQKTKQRQSLKYHVFDFFANKQKNQTMKIGRCQSNDKNQTMKIKRWQSNDENQAAFSKGLALKPNFGHVFMK